MASQRSSSGYNNPGYNNQYDYDQLARYPGQNIVNAGNVTYIASSEIDNYCYEDDEEIQLSTIVSRQQRMVREPPIGASATFRFTETAPEENIPRLQHNNASRVSYSTSRIPSYNGAVVPMSPKRHRYEEIPERYEEIPEISMQETMVSPRTPKKTMHTAMSTPRKQHVVSPRRSQSFSSPRRQNLVRVPMPLSPGPSPRRAIMTTSPMPLSPGTGARRAIMTSPMPLSPGPSPRRAIMTSPMPLSPGPSPRRTIMATSPMPLSPGPSSRRAILGTPPMNVPIRNVQYIVPPRTTVTPRRNTAIIPPTYTTANSSVISTTPATPQKKGPFLATGGMYNRSPVKMDISPDYKESWIHAPMQYQVPPTGTIVTAAGFLLICGLVTAVLSLYMMSKNGKLYYLAFGVLSGFSSALLGCLGFRSRRWHWLPNRNYVSGYVVVCLFSVLACAALIAIFVLNPKPGEPLADVAGGAVSGLAALSLTIAAIGLMLSRCCKYPPPDNRVEHCAEGFTL